MVLADHIDDGTGQFVSEAQIDSFFDMAFDYQGTERGGFLIMRIAPIELVFCKVFRFHQFANIVEHGADTG